MAQEVSSGLSPRRPEFNTGSVHVGFVVDKVTPSTLVFLCQFHSTGAPLLGKMKKKLIIFLVIFITRVKGLHNKT
jgi:hypothetical protein